MLYLGKLVNGVPHYVHLLDHAQSIDYTPTYLCFTIYFYKPWNRSTSIYYPYVNIIK
jgi:hypothetical protein